MSVKVYRNDGLGGPVDARSPVATLADSATGWADPTPVPPGGKVAYLVTRTDGSGVESLALTARTSVATDAAGADVAGRPPAPRQLSARPDLPGRLKVEWLWLPRPGRPRATEFRVWCQPGSVDFGTDPTAVIPVAAGVSALSVRHFWAILQGLTGGTAYAVAVRAANAAGAEPNGTVVLATPTAAGPAAVQGLAAGATASRRWTRS